MEDRKEESTYGLDCEARSWTLAISREREKRLLEVEAVFEKGEGWIGEWHTSKLLS